MSPQPSGDGARQRHLAGLAAFRRREDELLPDDLHLTYDVQDRPNEVDVVRADAGTITIVNQLKEEETVR